jgi:hypothetical protein
MAEKQNFPVFSEKNWWALKLQFKSSMPSSVNTNFLKTLFSLTSNKAADTCIFNLKRLGLLDDDGKTTTLANEWRIDESYGSACNKMLTSTYPAELLALFPSKDVDRTKLKSWFMSQCGVGDNASGQMAALFVLLRRGEIEEAKQSSSKPPTNRKSDKKENASLSKNNHPENTLANSTEHPAKALARSKPNLHIDLQIHISPESTPEQIETIFACMAKHLYGEEK